MNYNQDFKLIPMDHWNGIKGSNEKRKKKTHGFGLWIFWIYTRKKSVIYSWHHINWLWIYPFLFNGNKNIIPNYIFMRTYQLINIIERLMFMALYCSLLVLQRIFLNWFFRNWKKKKKLHRKTAHLFHVKWILSLLLSTSTITILYKSSWGHLKCDSTKKKKIVGRSL